MKRLYLLATLLLSGSLYAAELTDTYQSGSDVTVYAEDGAALGYATDIALSLIHI